MKARHVQARIDKRGAMRCQPGCAGWVIRTNPGRPKIMACIACNAMHPDRLQVTDKLVAMLPLAKNGIAAVKQRLARERSQRRITAHVGAGLMRKALCGHRLGRTKAGRRFHRLAIFASAVNCDECIRLNAMTEEQRAEERRERGDALRAKFKTKIDESKKERAKRLAETEQAIEAGPAEAMVAVDILSEFDFDRVKLAVVTADSDPTRAAIAEQRAQFVDATLALAVTAHRHKNPRSRGHRRWVLRNKEGYANGFSDVACRFCGTILLTRGLIGNEYTIATDSHTVRCALRYLGATVPDYESSSSSVMDDESESEAAT